MVLAGKRGTLPNDFAAQAGELRINYRATDTPQFIKVEIQDGGGNALFVAKPTLVDTTEDKIIKIQIPNTTNLNIARKIAVIIDQNDPLANGDNSFQFRINAMTFMHFPSSQNLTPDSSLTSANVTDLPGAPVAQLVASNPPGNSLAAPDSDNVSKLTYDITGNNFSGISINFDPNNEGSSADLSNTDVIFGLSSSTVTKVKIEVDDASGKRAILFATDINSTQQYYKWLKTKLAGSIDTTKIKKINFIIDQSSVVAGGETGTLDLQLKL